MRQLTRRIAIVAAGVFGIATLASAGDFEDSAGRLVKLAGPVDRILPAGPPADTLLFALAPDKLIGLVEPFGPAQAALVPERLRGLPKVPRVTGRPDDTAVKALVALKPDLIVDYGDVNAGYADLADRMATTLAAPYALLDGRLVSAPKVVRALGGAIGREARAGEIASAIEGALAFLALVAALPPEQRVSVYYARGADGLNAIRAGSSLDEGIALAGGRNITPAGRGAFTAQTIDDIVKAQPAVVILADEKAAARDGALRKALPEKTRFIVDHGAPFAWIENPPSLNRLIGALALAEMLYPDRAAGGRARAAQLAQVMFPGVSASAGLGE